MIELYKGFIPSNLIGTVVEIKKNCLAIEVGQTYYQGIQSQPQSQPPEHNQIPYLQSYEQQEVLFSYFLVQPFVMGALSGIGCKKERVSGDKVSLDVGDRKVVIKNKYASNKLILEKINNNSSQ
ncbi:hypothetical protein DB313_04535 [Borrelia turcica IST7]|uniref:Uncharacterized protein n=2 Tax=Borrelia turcica TaxID=229155 RepID=A0A386PNL0_9SPIR|nr:hypothetical protein DB313_04535 [Borrelia turcica IST7]